MNLGGEAERVRRERPVTGVPVSGGVRDTLRRRLREQQGTGLPVRGRRLRDLLGQNGRDLYD